MHQAVPQGPKYMGGGQTLSTNLGLSDSDRLRWYLKFVPGLKKDICLALAPALGVAPRANVNYHLSLSESDRSRLVVNVCWEAILKAGLPVDTPPPGQLD